MALSPLNILMHIINIDVLYLLLRVLLYKPIRKFLDKREQKIRTQLEDAEETSKKAQALLEQYQAQLAEAEEQAKQITQEGTARPGAAPKSRPMPSSRRKRFWNRPAPKNRKTRSAPSSRCAPRLRTCPWTLPPRS